MAAPGFWEHLIPLPGGAVHHVVNRLGIAAGLLALPGIAHRDEIRFSTIVHRASTRATKVLR